MLIFVLSELKKMDLTFYSYLVFENIYPLHLSGASFSSIFVFDWRDMMSHPLES
jgi:hypothetical protein